jgi:hypothetical protein
MNKKCEKHLEGKTREIDCLEVTGLLCTETFCPYNNRKIESKLRFCITSGNVNMPFQERNEGLHKYFHDIIYQISLL